MSAPSGYKLTKTPNLPPEAMKLYNQLVNSLGGGGVTKGIDYLSRLAGGDEDIFKQIEAPAYQALQQSQAQTANRFSGVGAQDSSAFSGALAGQAGQMATDLASQRQQLMQGAIDKLLNYSQQTLGQKPYDYQLQEEGIDWESMIKTFGPAIIGLLLGGPPGAVAGAGVTAGGISRKPYG